ncbi:MAG: methionine--tRNA ligase subunit beta, partial [Patescibacteria group bacterium]
KNMITIDDFKKIDLRVVKIIAAQRVEGSDKLLKLQVDMGEEKRQIVAGIGLAYDPETLIGREIIVVANLEPRLLMGVESQGMLLAASNDHPVLLQPEKEVAPGSSIR